MAEPNGVAQPALSLWLHCETEDNTTLRGCCAYRSRRYSGEDTPLESVRMTSAARFFVVGCVPGIPGLLASLVTPTMAAVRHVVLWQGASLAPSTSPCLAASCQSCSCQRFQKRLQPDLLAMGLFFCSLWRRGTWQVVFASLAIPSH